MNSFFADMLGKLNVTAEAYQTFFPPETKLDDIQAMVDQNTFPTLEGLAPAFTWCIILTIARYFLHYLAFKPLAETTMKIREVPLIAIPDIDKAFPKAKDYVEPTSVKAYCQTSGRKALDVKKYLWTRRRNSVTKARIVKYVEALWRFIFYSTFCVLGYYVLFVPTTAAWIIDSNEYFEGWPLHPMSAAILLYYQVELGCYMHQLMWTEVSRSDALEMIAHHLITIALIVISYLTNYMRFGVSVLFLHDLADVVLESAKVLNYISKAKEHKWLSTIVDGLFGVFAVTFFVTRLVLFPRYILYVICVDGWAIYGCEWGGCYFFIGFLMALQCLHIFWFYLIMRMVVKMVFVGTIEKDERSDDEDDDVADEFTEAVYDHQSSSSSSSSSDVSKKEGDTKKKK